MTYEASFYDDARSQFARQQIVDFPEKLQVSVESDASEVEMNPDGVSFYRSANITGLAVVLKGSAPSATVETKRNENEDKNLTIETQTTQTGFTAEQNKKLGEIAIQRAEAELAQIQLKNKSLESGAELERAKVAELERGKLDNVKVGENWLDTPEATFEFGRAMLENEGQSPFKEIWNTMLKRNDETSKIERSAKKFAKSWKKTLVTRGIAGFQAPTGFLEAINDAVTHNALFWDLLNHTGLQTLQVSPASTPEGKGWANNQDAPTTPKTESKITLAPRQLTPQDIYIYTTIARSTLLLNKDTNAVINFVLQQLPKAVIETVEKAIVLGVTGIDSIKSILGEVTAVGTANPADWVQSQADLETPREALKAIAENVTIDNNIVVVMSKASYTKLKWEEVTDNKTNKQLVIPFEATKQGIADVFGFARIITPDWMKGHDEIIGFSAGEFLMVGNSTAESFQDFDLPYNRERFLMEIFAGGSLAGLGRAFVTKLKAPVVK